MIGKHPKEYQIEELKSNKINDFLDTYDNEINENSLEEELKNPFDQHSISSLKQRLANPMTQFRKIK